ncbi:MAG: four helix bundle protein [Chloroflexota bacterium]
MKEGNVLQDKSYAFALRIVKTYQYLSEEKREYTLSKQLLRSGTSIGANVEEALGGRSDKDFAFKLSVAYKEARESHYWIRLLCDTGYLTTTQADSLLADADELLRILGSILKTMKSRNQL